MPYRSSFSGGRDEEEGGSDSGVDGWFVVRREGKTCFCDWVKVDDIHEWDVPPEEVAENALQLDGTVDQEFTDHYTGAPNHYEGSYDWKANGTAYLGFVPAGLSQEIYGGYIYLHDVGQRRSKFHWVRETDPMTGQPDPNDNPPEVLRLKITASALGGASSDTSGQLRDTTKEHVTASVMGEEGTENNGVSLKTASANVVRLISVATNGQDDVWGPWVDYDVEVQVDGDRFISQGGGGSSPLPGWASVDLSYSAQEDNRSAKITSSTIEPSSYKALGPTPPTGYDIGDPVPHQRNADGSITVDSVAKWFDSESGVVPGWYGGGIFTADTPNFSNPTREWSLEGGVPTYYADSIIGAGYQSITLPNDLYSVDGSPTVRGIRLGGTFEGSITDSQSTFTLKATDTDSAVGKNTFIINWHKPEEWETPPYQIDDPIWDSAEPVAITQPEALRPGSVAGKWKHENYYLGAISEAGQISFQAASTLTPTVPQKLFFKAAGIVLGNLVSEDAQALDASFIAVWESSLNDHFASAATWEDGRPTLPNGGWDNTEDTQLLYKLTNPHKIVEYQPEYYNGDAYDAQGFNGRIKKALRRFTGRASITGEFVLNASSPGS